MSLVEHISRALARTHLSGVCRSDLLSVAVERRWPEWQSEAIEVVECLRTFDVAGELVFPVLDRIFGSKAGSETRTFSGDKATWQTLWQRLLDEASGTNRQASAKHTTKKPVAYCQPRYEGKIQPPKFIIRFEDAELGDLHFDDEAEARSRFSDLSVSWNCFLFGTLPVEPRAEATEIEQDYQRRIAEFSAWLSRHGSLPSEEIHAEYLKTLAAHR
jgi:hypothetical protein